MQLPTYRHIAIRFTALQWPVYMRQLLVFEVAHEAQPASDHCPGYGDLTLGGTELEKLKILHILGVTLDSKLTYEAHLREDVSRES